MTVRPRPVTRRAAGALLALLLVAATGCTSSGDAETSGAVAEPAVGESRGGAPDAGSDMAAASTGGGAGALPAGALTLPGDVVRTASLDVEVEDLRRAADRARTVAEDAGGGLEAEEASAELDVLRLRVAPDRLPAALDALARLGRETARSVGSEDVSDQVADLDSRLATQRASVERVRALLARAQALSDVVALEAQLAEREGALESLQARAAALRAKADLATVTVTLRLPDPTPATAQRGFRDGLDAGVGAFLAAAGAAAVVLGALLPFLPVLLLAAWGVRRWVRRAGPPAPPAPAPAGP